MIFMKLYTNYQNIAFVAAASDIVLNYSETVTFVMNNVFDNKGLKYKSYFPHLL